MNRVDEDEYRQFVTARLEPLRVTAYLGVPVWIEGHLPVTAAGVTGLILVGPPSAAECLQRLDRRRPRGRVGAGHHADQAAQQRGG